MKKNLHKKVSMTGVLLITCLLFMTTSALAQVTYNGNDNTGFAGPVGESTLEFNDDGTTITGTFTKGSGDFNDAMVIYISTGITGRSVIDGDVDDQGDGLRRAISSAGTNASDITFPTGFEASHAIAIDTNFGGLFSIPTTGSIGDNQLDFVDGVGNPSAPTDNSFTFSFDYSEIGLSNGESFTFVITYLNAGNGFLSNEGYGDGLPAGNPGADNVTFTTFFEYPSGNKLAISDVDDNELTNAFKVYPNPVTDGLVNIQPANSSGEASISIYNMLGKRVLKTTKNIRANSKTSLNLGNHQSGVYAMEIRLNGKSFKQQIILK